MVRLEKEVSAPLREGLNKDQTGHEPKLTIRRCAMSGNAPSMGDDLVSPAEVEAQASASAGEPDVSRLMTLEKAVMVTRWSSQEDQARALLEGCDGLEPPYEYMSVEGTAEHPEEQGVDEPATESPEAIS